MSSEYKMSSHTERKPLIAVYQSMGCNRSLSFTIRSAENIVVSDSGTVAEQGTYCNLMSLKGIFWNLVNVQRTDFLAGTENESVDRNSKYMSRK